MTTSARRFIKNLFVQWREAPIVPAVLLLIAGSLWGFIELADEVGEHETHHWDRAILMAMREPGDPSQPVGPYWVEEIGRDLTALGGFTVLSLLTLAVCGFLLIKGKQRTSVITMAAVAGGLVLTHFLKTGFDRPRPDLVPHGVVVTTASFPSGHAMMAAVVYLTLGVLLARTVPGRSLRVYVIACATGIAMLVGISRVYLGVHWPTDVLAGWTLGAGWALLCWLFAVRFDSAPSGPSAKSNAA